MKRSRASSATSRPITSSGSPARTRTRTAGSGGSRSASRTARTSKSRRKAGYYADRDFAHTAKTDRETQLQEQLTAPIPATDVPIFVTAGWFRIAAESYYVPISGRVRARRCRRRAPARRSTSPDSSATNAACRSAGFATPSPCRRRRRRGSNRKQVLYRTGVTLPPGRFSIKVVVRENADGQMGSFEAPIVVPELKQSSVKVSSLVLGTQLQQVAGGKHASPLVHDGVEIVPNLTHIVGRDQTIYFYYEVYDPASGNGSPQLQTSLAFYRGKVKVFETPVVERTTVDAPVRHAAVFQFEVPGGSFRPGLYTCQVNIIDVSAARFAFPRLEMYVR